MFRSNIPKWVSKLPNTYENKEVLIQLAKASGNPLQTPREMNFSIKDILRKNELSEIAETLALQGWSCEASPDHNNQERWWIEAKKNEYVLDKDQLELDEELFRSLADHYHATYDGWYASVV